MMKTRVYEYAKKHNMSSKEILNLLKRLNIEVANHMSIMDEEMVNKIEEHMAKLRANARFEKGSGTHSVTASQPTETHTAAASRAPEKRREEPRTGQGQPKANGQEARKQSRPNGHNDHPKGKRADHQQRRSNKKIRGITRREKRII
jgi:translation initiation factor IF-2